MPWNHRRSNRVTITLSVLVALCIVGCSRYTPQSTVIPEKNLAEYNPKNFSTQTLPKRLKFEDEWIMKAIWYEQEGDFKQSNVYYNKLYQATQRDEYLLKELMTAFYGGATSNNLSKLEEYTLKHPDDLKAKRLLLSFYLNEKEYDKAKEVGQALIAQSTEAVDFELSANPYIYSGDYAKAVNLLDKAYEKTANEDILLKITAIMANYMNNIEGAIDRLEDHRVNQECSEKICLQLLDIYSQQRNIDKLTAIYKALYASTQKEIYAEKLIESYLYKKDYAKSIGFLKQEYKNNELLYALYIEKKDYLKADELAKQLLEETKDPKWYAESAMALYEGTVNKDDKAMLTEVVKRFEKAVSAGIESSVYLNYYGYTLIDKDINVARGIEIIKKALLQDPDNTYYLDSLAWGHYKSGNCKEAYSIMKKVIDIEGLEEEELIEHWNAIHTKCKP
ncbi:hypothetical protein KKC13_07880 [bacterium]|nr:hypothetical protein [bacterium]MBU1959072.1 hypothetical protein [bacterium]